MVSAGLNEAIPGALVDRLKTRQALLVAGLGCSALAGLPGWPEILRRIAARLRGEEGPTARRMVEDLLGRGRRSAAMAYLRARVPPAEVAEALAEAFPHGLPVPEPLALLALLPWRGVIVTAFDDLWDRALTGAPEPFVHLDPGAYGDTDAVPLAGRYFVHVLGQAHQPQRLCLAPADLRRGAMPARVSSFVRHRFQERSFVFLGFEPDDPDLVLLLRGLLGGAPSGAQHFLLWASAPRSLTSNGALDVLRAELDVTVVPYGGTLDDVAHALVDAWRPIADQAQPADDDIEAWLAIAGRDPTDGEARRVLDRIETRLRMPGGDRAALASLLIGRSSVEPRGATALRVEAARLLAQEGRESEAAGIWREAVIEDSGCIEARDLLTAFLRRSQRWTELGEALELLATTGHDRARQIEAGLELGQLRATRLRDLDGAIAAYRQVLSRDAESLPALRALEPLLRERERWRELASLLDTIADLTADAHEALEVKKARAQLLTDRTDDLPAIIAAWEAVVAGDWTDGVALRTLAGAYERAGRLDDALRTLEESLRARGAHAEAFAALARLHRSAGNWQALADATVRQIDTTVDPAAKAALHAEVGRIYEEQLHDPRRAVEAYAAAQALGDVRPETFEALARLNLALEDWWSAVAALEKWAGVLDEPARAADAYVKAAQILSERLADQPGAEVRYDKAVEADPMNREALVALAHLATDRRDFERAVRFLVAAEVRTNGKLEKARLLADAAVLLLDRLDDPQRAEALLARAVALDPEQARAAARLAPLLEARGEGAAAEPLLEGLLRRVDRRDTAATLDLLMRLGKAAEAGGNRPRALRAYDEARAITPSAIAPLQAAAGLRFAAEEWGEAARLLEELVRAHEGELGEALPDLQHRLGLAEQGLGNHEAAASWFNRALEHDPGHRPSRVALAERHLIKGDYPAWVGEMRALVEAAPGTEKAALHERIGDAYRDRLGDVAQSIAAYRSALTVQPERRSVLEKLFALYTEHKHWRAAVETLEKLAALEPVPADRAALLQRAARIERDELESPGKAVEILERALDDEPTLVPVIDAIEQLLTESEEWKELARILRTVARRLSGPETEALRVRLWHAVGELSRTRLDDREGARAAYAAADALEPRHPGRQAILVELYGQAGPEHAAEAIALHQRLVAADPDRLASYRALAQLYRTTGRQDELWCVAATLNFLRKADHELRAVFEAQRQATRATLERVPAELWASLVHPDEDGLVDRLFALGGPSVALAAAEAHTVFGLRRADRADVGSDERPFARALARACHALGMTPPDLFFDSRARGGVVLRNLREGSAHTPALVVGGAVPKMEARELEFRAARAAAMMRPAALLRGLGTPSFLAGALETLLALGGALPVPMDPLSEEVAALLPPERGEPLGEAARRLVAERGPRPDVTAWIAGVDLTAARLAFALTGDLAAAAQVIAADPADSSPLPAKRRLKDLVGFSVSEGYFAVRRALGVVVEPRSSS
jgi:lipopolysaccharide biosynthesis regulator YciM